MRVLGLLISGGISSF